MELTSIGEYVYMLSTGFQTVHMNNTISPEYKRFIYQSTINKINKIIMDGIAAIIPDSKPFQVQCEKLAENEIVFSFSGVVISVHKNGDEFEYVVKEYDTCKFEVVFVPSQNYTSECIRALKSIFDIKLLNPELVYCHAC
jgi:hypothetical protein